MPDNAPNPLSDESERTVTTPGSTLRAATPIELEAGSVLDERYQIEAVLGQGGSGTVFRAWDRVLGEPIAIKILRPDRAMEKSWIKRLAREVKVARAIRHPNVCRVFDLGNANGHWFVTMELAAGGSLRELLRQEITRPLSERLEDARALCAGLAAIHAVGITHRDVTPQNVLRMTDGRLVLSDFGLAIDSNDNTTVHGGTPNYMPPETLMGERADQRSDVWQLGVILHEVMYGRRPGWNRVPAGVVMQWPLAADASPVEEEVARLCRDCLAQNPAARPITAMAVAGRLAAAEVARPRGAMSRLWLRGRGFAQRHRRTARGAVAVVLLGCVVWTFRAASRPALCRAADQKLAGIWDPRTKSLVRRAFAHTGRTYAADAFWGVNRVVERYLTHWEEMYKETCEATHVRGEQSAEVMDLRMSCLQDRLDEVRAVSHLLQVADVGMVANAVDAANAMRSVDRCRDVRTLRAVVQPPEQPKTRQEVAHMRARLADVKALRDTGRHAAALESVTALEPEARALGYDPLTAEMLSLRAWLVEKNGDYPAALRAYEEALSLAETARHDELAAEVTVSLVGTLGFKGQVEEARRWAGLAGALLRRLGGHELLEGWLENNLGLLDDEENRHASALERFRKAAELKQRALGPDNPDVALSLGNVAITLSKLGRYEEALSESDRAMAIFRKAYGADNPTVAMHLSNRGEILTGLHRFGDAREAFRRALVIQERELGRDHADLGYALLGIGNSLVAEGRAAEAVPVLERALRIRERRENEQARVAEARFALARALWEIRAHRERALQLAASARDTYGRLGLRAGQIEADAWLRRREHDDTIAVSAHGVRGR